MRQNTRRKKVNDKKTGELKLLIKQFKKSAASNKEEAKKLLPKVYEKLDKSAKINLIKKNTAARLKSRLSKKLSLKK